MATRQIYGGSTITSGGRRVPRRGTTPSGPTRTTNTSSMLSNPAFRDMNQLGTEAQEAQIRPVALDRLSQFGTSGTVGGIHNQQAQQGSGGMSEFDLLQAMLTGPTVGGAGGSAGGGGSRGGSRGGGGGGGMAGVSPEMSAAFQAYMEMLQNQANPMAGYRDKLAGLYDTGWMDKVFDPSRVNSRFDAQGQQVGSAGSAGRNRLSDIAQALDARTRSAGQEIQGGFNRSGQALRGLASQFQRGQAGEAAGLNRILNSFDAGSVQAESAPLQNLMRAGQTTNDQAANLFRQSMADRAQLSGQLQSDVGLQMSQQEQGLLSRIAQQRADALHELDSGRMSAEAQARQAQQRLDADLWMKEMEAQAAQQQALAEARLRAAELGITL